MNLRSKEINNKSGLKRTENIDCVNQDQRQATDSQWSKLSLMETNKWKIIQDDIIRLI